jgi:hypothetical protein
MGKLAPRTLAWRHKTGGVFPQMITILVPDPWKIKHNLRGGTRKVGEQERNRRKKKGERARKIT